MISHISFLQLEMRNFKRFRGTHLLDLSTDAATGRNLVLIGGDNGRGKTSIHEAINYALYVDDDLPGISTRPSYERAVFERLNRRAVREGETDFFVAVNLSIGDSRQARHIRIERRWEISHDRRAIADSSLRLFENGKAIDHHDNDYQEFLRGIIPPRIAPFFFFDGERIQELASDNFHADRFVEAIEDLFQISVYKSLCADLGKYVIEHLHKTEIDPNVADGELSAFQVDIARLEREMDKRSLAQQVDRDEIRQLRDEQSKVDARLSAVGGREETSRDQLVVERKRHEQEYDRASSEIKDAFEGMLLLLAGGVRRSLLATISRPVSELGEAARQDLSRLRDAWIDSASSLLQGRIQTHEIESLRAEFDRLQERLFHSDDRQLCVNLHDLPGSLRGRVAARLFEVERAPQRLRSAMDARDKAESDVRRVEKKLAASTDDPIVPQLIRRTKEISQRIGELEQKIAVRSEEIVQIERDKKRCELQYENCLERHRYASKALKSAQLARRCRHALDLYVDFLKKAKLKQFNRLLDETYLALRKPEDPVRGISIDPTTWEVILRDEFDHPLEKRVFSAGMKEMLALAMLWALTRASGRELPIVIDTPAGRLDSTNRRALFENYLPHAGHQVIVLSTDTEVDMKWAHRLEPYVARQYRLDFDPEQDSTVISEGYFFGG